MDFILARLEKLSADHDALIPMRKFSAILGVPMYRMRRWCTFGVQKSVKRTPVELRNGHIKPGRGRPKGNHTLLLKHERFGEEYRTSVRWVHEFIKVKDG